MKKTLFSALFLVVIIGTKAQTNAYSPCTDSTYLALKTKSINTMSEREFAYFSQKDKECADFIRTKDAEEKAKAKIREQEQQTEKMMQDIRKKSGKAYVRSILWLGITIGIVLLVL